MCKSCRVTLPEFIRRHGDAHCAALFDVKVRTVASWRRGENFPRARKAREIVDRTNGQVGMEDIYVATSLSADLETAA